jgi:hypothetical protein
VRSVEAITRKLGKLVWKQTETLEMQTFGGLAPVEFSEYNRRLGCIRELCRQLRDALALERRQHANANLDC